MFVIILLVSAVATVYGRKGMGQKRELPNCPYTSCHRWRGNQMHEILEVGMVRKNIGPMWDGVIRFFPERVLPTTSQKLRETPSCERT